MEGTERLSSGGELENERGSGELEEMKCESEVAVVERTNQVWGTSLKLFV